MADQVPLAFNAESKKKKKTTKTDTPAEVPAKTEVAPAEAPAAEPASSVPVFNPADKRRSTKKSDAAAPKEQSVSVEIAKEAAVPVVAPKLESSLFIGEDEPEYPYKEILDRFYSLVVHNPDGGTVIKLPQIAREGSKKTVWVNFQDICLSMNRTIEHVTSYVLAELGTDGNMDGSNRLVIKGRYNPRQIESILKRYISEYVTCQMCKCRNTDLVRHQMTRLFFVKCNACQSSRSVAVIKTGYKAQIGRRQKDQ